MKAPAGGAGGHLTPRFVRAGATTAVGAGFEAGTTSNTRRRGNPEDDDGGGTASRRLLVGSCGRGLGCVGVTRLLVVEDCGANVPRQTLACEEEEHAAGASATAAVATHEAASLFDLLRLAEEGEARLVAQVVDDSLDLRERTFIRFPEGLRNCVDSLITSHG